MKRLLLVDDDALVLKIYKDRLTEQGFEVRTAPDGLAALQVLREYRPDVMVLDLMMPRFSGVDVLKALRAQPELASLPVVVLSNAYMDNLAREAAAIGVHKALLKTSCKPSLLTSVIEDILAGRQTPEDPAHLMAVSQPEAPAPAAAAPPSPTIPEPARPGPEAVPAGSPPAAAPKTGETAFKANARREFVEQAAATCGALRNLFQALRCARSGIERGVRLQNFYRQVHFVTTAAGLADCQRLAQMASIFEAMLFEAMDRQAELSPSALRTMEVTIDFLETLFQQARSTGPEPPLKSQVLAVDDDAVSNRLVVAALRRAQLLAQGLEDPLAALQRLQERHYDLILLDIEMPGMDGFTLCRRLRALPGYEKTPVIYVTRHSDFESRSRSVLSGGQDLISKPVFPMELAVKAITHLMKSQMWG